MDIRPHERLDEANLVVYTLISIDLDGDSHDLVVHDDNSSKFGYPNVVSCDLHDLVAWVII